MSPENEELTGETAIVKIQIIFFGPVALTNGQYQQRVINFLAKGMRTPRSISKSIMKKMTTDGCFLVQLRP